MTVASGDEVDYGTELTIEAALAPAYTQHGTLAVTVNDEAYTGTTYTVTGSYEGTESFTRKLERIMARSFTTDEAEIIEESEE